MTTLPSDLFLTVYFGDQKVSDILLDKMIEVGIAELKKPSYHPKISFYSKSRGLVSRMVGRSIRRPSYDYFWTNALIADGLLEHYRSSESLATRKALVDYHNSSKKQPGFRNPLYVDEAMNAYSFNALRKLSETGFDDETVSRFARFLLEIHPRTISGVLPYRPTNHETVLIDTIGMVCPFLSAYAIDFKCKSAMNLASSQVKEFLERGISEETGLPFHGYKSQTWEHLGGEGWGRGVGWLLMGLSSVLIHLPRDNSDYSFFLHEYTKILDAVFAKQNADGSFPELLLEKKSKSDTSATSMIAYSCAKTIEAGVLNEILLNPCLKAHEYIRSQVDSSGRVQSSSGEALGANNYARVFGWYPWGQGPSIALGAVLSRLLARQLQLT